MVEPQFDPSGMLQIDIGRGIVQLQGASPRLVVPADALIALCGEAGADAQFDFGCTLGTELGARVANRVGPQAANASVEVWVAHLGGEWALAGLGELGLERWGMALVITVDESPVGRQGDTLLEAILVGALQRGASRDLSVVALGRDQEKLRMVVLSSEVAQRVRDWLQEGVRWGDILMRLHEAQGGE